MHLIKYLCYTCMLLLSAAVVTACVAPTQQKEAEPDTPAVYYNDYLGLSITAPPGWYINTLANLSAQEGETTLPQLLEYADGSSRMQLIDMQSSSSSSDAEHSRFCAYAEIFPEAVEPEQYVELFVNLLQADNDGYTYTLHKQEQIPLARHTAERICLQVSGSNAAAKEAYTEDAYTEDAYMEEYYIVALEKAFVIFYMNYWPQNEASRNAAFSVLEQITLPAPT